MIEQCPLREVQIEQMPRIDPNNDDFFGDQSSIDSPDSVAKNSLLLQQPSSDHSFGNVANHEYRSQEASIKTLSYLDGYDETKEERIQDGFSFGYKQSFHDAFKIGSLLGGICASAALDESLLTSGDKDKGSDNHGVPTIDNKLNLEALNNIIQRPAKLVREFLKDEILIGSKEGDSEKKYDEALSKLNNQLEKVSIQP